MIFVIVSAVNWGQLRHKPNKGGGLIKLLSSAWIEQKPQLTEWNQSCGSESKFPNATLVRVSET